jgi:hypothetical protein
MRRAILSRMEHACRNCGLDQRFGEHMLMSAREGNPDSVSVVCRVPHDEVRPLSFHFVSTHDIGKGRVWFTPLSDDW